MGQSTPILKPGARIVEQDDALSLATASNGAWTRIQIETIEDLADAVHGAGLSAVQLSRTPPRGSLAFAEYDGIQCSSGMIDGSIALNGPLSESMVTFGVGLKMRPNNRQWLQEVDTGAVAIYMPGDEHTALLYPGSLYSCVTLSLERAEEIAAISGLVLKPRKLGGSGIDNRCIAKPALQKLTLEFERLHACGEASADLAFELLRCLIEHFGRRPQPTVGAPEYRGYSRIVRRGLDFIDGNLHRRLAVEEIAVAAETSPRTLFRAFATILGETPLAHVSRLRLHRVRHDLLTASGDHATVTSIASHWGIGELGRFAGTYSDLFGENPSETLAARRGRANTYSYPEIAD